MYASTVIILAGIAIVVGYILYRLSENICAAQNRSYTHVEQQNNFVVHDRDNRSDLSHSHSPDNFFYDSK